ncbi:MAG: hypothetical protein RRA94_09225, partial [Bacteroidota bacterium]|nr:hypothetical protein [Bacteroidota bacterium]
MHTRDLIARGLELTREKRKIDAELATLRRQLEPLFPAKETCETIDFECGSAVRTVRREWWIQPGKLNVVRKILGKGYAHMIDKEMPLSVTAALRGLLKNDHSELAMQIRPYIIVNRAARIDFRDPLSDTVVTTGNESEVVS